MSDRLDTTIVRASQHLNQQRIDLLNAESLAADLVESNGYLVAENSRLRKALGEK